MKKLVSEYISLDDIYDECDNCRRPILLHQNPGDECTRDVDETLEVVVKNWKDLKKCLKPILKEIKEERSKEKEQNVYLDGIREIVNTLKMNMDTSGDPKVKKSDPAGVGTVNNKPKLLTKPAKVPMWTKDLTLETYIKQIQSWSDVLEEIPEHVKYADLIESLKTNKEIKGLQKYV